MRQIDRVDTGLLPQLMTCGDPDLPITRRTLKAVRDRSIQRIATKPVFGTTVPRSEVIATPDGPVCLDVFEPKDRCKLQTLPALVAWWRLYHGAVRGYVERAIVRRENRLHRRLS